MTSIANFLSFFPSLSPEHLNALIALSGLGVAAFAIYAMLTAIKAMKR